MSRTQAIYDMCKMCIYDPKGEGTWRNQVEACTSEKSCPLWPYRPVSLSTGIAKRTPRIPKQTDLDKIVNDLEDEKED